MTLKDNISEVIAGQHVAALATLSEGKPEVRFVVLEGQPGPDPCRGNDESQPESPADTGKPGCGNIDLVWKGVFRPLYRVPWQGRNS